MNALINATFPIVSKWKEFLNSARSKVTVVLGSSMPPHDPSPSPERDPQQSGFGPRRPELRLRELDPLGAQIALDNLDRLTDVLHLCGITLGSSSIEALWSSLLKERITNIQAFRDAEGPLGLNLELDIISKHEIAWRGHSLPEQREFDERVSVTFSTKHRDGSELAQLVNLSENQPALDGLFVEIISTPMNDTPATAHIFWDEKDLTNSPAGERWSLLRGFFSFMRDADLPDTAPLAPGQRESFHYLTVDLDPLLVKVQRLPDSSANDRGAPPTSSAARSNIRPVEIRLLNPPRAVIEEVLSLTGALQLTGPWVDDNTSSLVLSHLFSTLRSSEKLNIDLLKMCEDAQPCVVFSREVLSNGAVFPPAETSRIKMCDYTCRAGDLHLELTSDEERSLVNVTLRWDSNTARAVETDWTRIHLLTKPYLAKNG